MMEAYLDPMGWCVWGGSGRGIVWRGIPSEVQLSLKNLQGPGDHVLGSDQLASGGEDHLHAPGTVTAATTQPGALTRCSAIALQR